MSRMARKRWFAWECLLRPELGAFGAEPKRNEPGDSTENRRRAWASRQGRFAVRS